MELVAQVGHLLLPWAAAWFVVVMLLRTAVVVRRGTKADLGVAKGDPRRGVAYSMTFAMLPWKKESTRIHRWTYAGGMGMHIGVFSLVLLGLGQWLWTWPPAALSVFGVLAGIGWISALGLFLKRATKPAMHAISSPDDFLSNGVVQLYLACGMLAAFGVVPPGVWSLAAVALLFYAPVGKIFHMLLFFVSRTLFGLQFGRRGVLRHDIPVTW